MKTIPAASEFEFRNFMSKMLKIYYCTIQLNNNKSHKKMKQFKEYAD